MSAAHKWVYHFTEGSAAARSAHGEPRDLLGGKGAGAAEMTKAGMPVPPGFTITTEACRAYLANKGKFPPGMWDTVLNLGLDEETTKGLAALTKDERFALDARRRFIQMFGKTVMGIDGEKFEHAL